jgi:hypothetical protein
VSVERDRHRSDPALASTFYGSRQDGPMPEVHAVEEPHGYHARFLVEGQRAETGDGPHGR